MSARRQDGTAALSEGDPYRTRTVSSWQASWQGRQNGDGRFTLQFVLDEGAEHRVIEVAASDFKVILQLMKARRTMFDGDREMLLFL